MNIKELKKHAPYILAILVLSLLYFHQFYNEELPARDISVSYLPHLETLKASAMEYKDFWPLWNPYGFGGDPLLMKPLPGMDSLMGVLILTVSNTTIALKLYYLLLFILSGISMYALMIYFKVDRKFAFISALVYMFNGYMIKLIVWGWGSTLAGYAILPLAFLYGIKALKEKETIKNSIIAGIIFAVLLRFNQDMKVTMWFGLLFGIYVLFHVITKPSKKRLIKTISVSLLLVLILFGLSAQRIMPNMDFIKVTSRSGTDTEFATGRQMKYPDMFNRLIEPIYKGMPKIQRNGTGDHIGIIAFLLVIFAIYKKNKSKIVIFFSIGALFSIFVATNTFNIYYMLWRFVPFFKSLRYLDRSLFLFAFCCSILAGIGANEFFKNIKNKKNLVYFTLIVLILANLGLFGYKPYSFEIEDLVNVNEAIKNNHILQYLSKERQNEIFRIQTWETRGIDFGTDVYNVPLRLEHLYKYDGIWYPPYMNVYLSVAYNDPAKFWGMLNLKYLTSQTELNMSGFKFVKKFENCTVCFTIRDELQKAWGPYLYENELFLPRAHIVNNSILVIGEEESVTQTIYGLMLNQNFKPHNTVIIRGKKSINDYEIADLTKYSAIFLTKGSIDQNSIFKLEQFIKSGGILLPDITKNKNSISDDEISSLFNSFKNKLNPINDKNIIMHNFDKREIILNGQKGFLVYSEKFSVFPGWTVKNQDKKKLPLLNANAMGSAVYLEGNEKSLIFEYKPKSFIIGSIITVTAIILLIIFFMYNLFKRKKEKDNSTNSL